MTYDPRVRVEAFRAETGTLGEIVLSTFNAIDPFHCYYGEDCNPDEYLGYAERLIKALQRARVFQEELSEELVVELVRRAFYPSQVVNGWVKPDEIGMISWRVFERLRHCPTLLPAEG